MADSQNGSTMAEAGSGDPRESVDLGAIAALFGKSPGPTIMAVGTLLCFAAAGIRIGGVEVSGREFSGFEFGSVFFGGIVLIALGVAVLIVRDRLAVADKQRLLTQKFEYGLAVGRARVDARTQTVAQLAAAGAAAEQAYPELDAEVETLFRDGFQSQMPEDS
jgi:hypothetical protein